MGRIGRVAHRKVLVASVAAALSVLVPGTAHGAFPGTNGPIAFDSNRDVGAGEIYAVTPGGAAARLTNSTASSDPAYSPDGSRIAFIAGGTPGGTYQVFVMNADGSNVRQVTTSATAKQDPAWAPDGNTIAYSANSFDVDGQTDLEIWAVNADGSGVRQITSNAFPDTYPAWSPNGGAIAFVSARTGDTNRNIYVMAPDGSGQTNITPNTSTFSAHDDDPAWSPDGARIAFVHTNEGLGGGPPAIWTMGPDGSGKANLTNNPGVSFTMPAWSPQGDRLAAVGTASGTTNRDIWAMNADGSGQAPVEQNPAHDTNPDWGQPWTAPPSPPALGLSGKKSQELGRTVSVNATCDEPCEVEATGKVVVSGPNKTKLGLKRAVASIGPAEQGTLKLKLSKKKLQQAEEALDAKGARAKANLKVAAADPAGAEATAKRTIKLRD
jgi:dipeptidyl aminopeptidase/acylaminoacyl peptidase